MEGFVPRITVAGDDDANLVFAALVAFQTRMSEGVIVYGDVDLDNLRHSLRAAELALIVGEEMHDRSIAEMANIPDDLSGIDSD